ncbi:hypothetical protein IQ07DRAFT_594020 [Pyrenochaeta sp. DS3sAY3a]|nr:hypothetical protein IQ07DRAFT_594020 [Pyrenochaeta sp. DS3sAY3a]
MTSRRRHGETRERRGRVVGVQSQGKWNGHISISSGPHGCYQVSDSTTTVAPRRGAEQATDSGHSDQHARGSMLAGSRSRLRSSMSSQYRVLRAPSGSRVQSVDGGRVQPQWQIASPRQRTQRQIIQRVSAARPDSATCLPCRACSELGRGFTAGGVWQSSSGRRQPPAAIFYTASVQLLNGTLIASVGSVCACARSFVGGLTLALPALTLSAPLCATGTAASPSRASP